MQDTASLDARPDVYNTAWSGLSSILTLDAIMEKALLQLNSSYKLESSDKNIGLIVCPSYRVHVRTLTTLEQSLTIAVQCQSSFG